MFLFAVADSAVEEADVYVFVWHVFHIFVFYVHGYGPKTMSAICTTSKIFSFMSKTAISHPPQLAAQ
jgi:hypothetical protein